MQSAASNTGQVLAKGSLSPTTDHQERGRHLVSDKEGGLVVLSSRIKTTALVAYTVKQFSRLNMNTVDIKSRHKRERLSLSSSSLFTEVCKSFVLALTGIWNVRDSFHGRGSVP